MKLYSIQNKIIWPLLVVIVAGAAAMAIFIYRQAADNMHQKGLTTTEIARLGIENALIARKTAEEVMEQEMIAQATLVSYLDASPGFTYEQAAALAKKAGIDEIWITNDKGQVTVTNAGPSVDFNFASDPKGQAFEFMDLITGKRSVVTPPAPPRTIDPKIYKYVGVTGWKGKKIVQVGREGQRLTELENRIGAKPMIKQLKAELGDDVVFAAIAEPDGKLLYASDDKAAALDPTLQGTLKQSYDTKQTTMHTSAYDGKKVDYYVSVLSDNRAFVVALSTEVLTNIRNTIVIATAILVLLAGTVLFYIVHRQIRRLRLLQSAMIEIGEGDGDLTRRLPQTARDEIGVLSAAANRFIDKIHSIVADVKSATETSKADSDDMKQVSLQTMELAKEINVTIHQVATATNEQAEQVEQGLVAVQELAAYVDQSKRKTEDLSAARRSIEERQARGLDAVAALTRLMSRNVEVSQDAQRQLEQLKADIDAIAQMTDVIAGISRQTGLLALNASIEAARAGEHGKGFSVVATEVRKLSDQANAATEQIRATVDNVLASATNTAQSMDAVAGIVREQENSVRSTSSAFTDIREVLLEMNERIAQIASAMDVLDGKKETIVAFVESASAVSEQTAASAEEIVATVESQMTGFENVGRLALQLNRTMGRLQQAVDRFRI